MLNSDCCKNVKFYCSFGVIYLYSNSDSFTGSELDLNWASKPVTVDTIDGSIQVSSFAYKGTETKKVIVRMGSQAGTKDKTVFNIHIMTKFY